MQKKRKKGIHQNCTIKAAFSRRKHFCYQKPRAFSISNTFCTARSIFAKLFQEEFSILEKKWAVLPRYYELKVYCIVYCQPLIVFNPSKKLNEKKRMQKIKKIKAHVINEGFFFFSWRVRLAFDWRSTLLFFFLPSYKICFVHVFRLYLIFTFCRVFLLWQYFFFFWN